ncbi:hypothetical protein LTR22_014610 [Elasticomyces elasticus]|nr:hypothetical protein LTR22_014610 [Elasticomyces elasticus]
MWTSNEREAAAKWSWTSKELKAAAYWSTPTAIEENRAAETTYYYEHYAVVVPYVKYSAKVSPKLYEGNFTEWLETMQATLQGYGIWDGLQSPLMSRDCTNEEERDQLERDDTSAVNIMLDSLAEDFASRLALKRPISGFYLLQELRSRAKPFRFLNLPRELRDSVYAIALKFPHDHSQDETYTSPAVLENTKTRRRLAPKMALWINTGHEHQAMEHPLLLAVSRQVQDEADAIYWGKHTWKVEVSAYGEGLGVKLDLSTPKAQLQEWLDMIGIHRLKHLRDFILAVELCRKCSSLEFRIVLDATRGLQVLDMQSRGCYGTCRQDVLEWQLITTELRRKERGW